MEGKWHKRKIVLFLLLYKKCALEIMFDTTIRILDDCKLPEIINIKVYNGIAPRWHFYLWELELTLVHPCNEIVR